MCQDPYKVAKFLPLSSDALDSLPLLKGITHAASLETSEQELLQRYDCLPHCELADFLELIPRLLS